MKQVQCNHDIFPRAEAEEDSHGQFHHFKFFSPGPVYESIHITKDIKHHEEDRLKLPCLELIQKLHPHVMFP